jgi:hypothetical protein
MIDLRTESLAIPTFLIRNVLSKEKQSDLVERSSRVYCCGIQEKVS